MKTDEFLSACRLFMSDSMSLMEKKNADYSGVDDPFRNFRSCESLGIPTGVGIAVRMTDKMSRLHSILRRGECSVEDESAIDTLRDLCNYAAILAVWMGYGHED